MSNILIYKANILIKRWHIPGQHWITSLYAVFRPSYQCTEITFHKNWHIADLILFAFLTLPKILRYISCIDSKYQRYDMYQISIPIPSSTTNKTIQAITYFAHLLISSTGMCISARQNMLANQICMNTTLKSCPIVGELAISSVEGAIWPSKD